MAYSYKDGGTGVENGVETVKLIQEHAKSTYTDGALNDTGSFAGFFQMPKKVKRPVLVSCADSAGVKFRYAIAADKHDTIGIDAVATCVNNVVCHGARPLIYLENIATCGLNSEKLVDIVAGISKGCKQAGVALIDGKTAEMQGFYSEGDYDISGSAVGVVDRKKIINGSKIKKGDVLIGLKSSGLHSTGYSVVKKVFGEDMQTLNKYDEELDAKPINVLLAPSKIYVSSILSLIEKINVLGVAHVSDGGFVESLPKMLPDGLGCEIDTQSYELPNVYKVIQKRAELSDEEMCNTFNMGIGMVVCVREKDIDATIRQLSMTGEDCAVIGRVVRGSVVTLKKVNE